MRQTHPPSSRPDPSHADWGESVYEAGRHLRLLAKPVVRGAHSSFITPFGRYAFNRLPFGISSAPEHFQHCMSQMLEGCEGVVCHADDIVVHGEDIQQHNERLHRVLNRLREEGLTLNEKCEFAIVCYSWSLPPRTTSCSWGTRSQQTV
ncbi:hypothetical protein L3Q82_001560 [Scomber scombrus]|uniref:ribonuclease H n=1 Tax=Scomber scombrus TaxID=13677 RepID=A0AAV1QCC3_SCOSC